MAHAPGHDEGHPDLTAMLDVVMQMLLYFIMCARLINEEHTGDIKLPISQSAKPMVKGEGEVVIVRINSEGKVLVLGESPMNLAQAKFWLDKQAKEYRKDGRVYASVVIKADKDAGYENVYRIMQACKDKGFQRFKLRAEMIGG